MQREQAFNPIRSLDSSWRLIFKAPLPMAVGGLILVFVQQVSGSGLHFGRNFQFQFRGHFDPWELLPVFGPLMMLGFALFLVLYGVVAWLSVGYYNGVAEVMRTGDVAFDKLFDSRGRWLNALLARVLRDVIIAVSAGILVIPVLFGVFSHEALDFEVGVSVAAAILGGLALLPVLFYLWLGLVFVPQAVAFEGIGPVEAIARSWKLAAGQRMMLLLFWLLTFLIFLAGVPLCCFGGLQASAILVEVMWTEAYVQAVTGDETEKWWTTTGVIPESLETRTEEEPAWEEPVEPPVAAAPEPDEIADGTAPDGDGPFDPGAWRDQLDIPPFEERDEKS